MHIMYGTPCYTHSPGPNAHRDRTYYTSMRESHDSGALHAGSQQHN